MLDDTPAAITEPNGYAQISNFTFPGYDAYWAPYDNRTFFPPDDATIISVQMIAIVRCQIPQPFYLALEFYNHTTDSLTQITSGSPYFNAGQLDQLYSYNITNCGGWAPAWNATILKDGAEWGAPYWGSPDTQYGVKISVHIDTYYSRALYIDYIGLDYRWTNATVGTVPETPGVPGSDFNVVSIDVPAIMGIFGFVGMIAVPAASIWFYRRDGGSKVATAIIALVAFLSCFGMFFGVLNG
jgi:hypothetical protein